MADWMKLDLFRVNCFKDNDQYGHVNNAVFQSYFDTVANIFLIRHCGLDQSAPPQPVDQSEKSGAASLKDCDHAVAFIAECFCQFHEPIHYPNIYLGKDCDLMGFC